MRVVLILAGVFLVLAPGCAMRADHQFARRYSGYVDMAGAWVGAGVDEPMQLLAHAAAGHEWALKRILELGVLASLDAASSEGHADVLGDLLHHVGDRSFSRSLARTSWTVRNAVADDLSYDLAEENADVRKENWFASDYPLTWRALGGSPVPDAAKSKALLLIHKATVIDGERHESGPGELATSDLVESVAKVIEWRYTLELSRVLLQVPADTESSGDRVYHEMLVLVLDEVGEETFEASLGMQGTVGDEAVVRWWTGLPPARRSYIQMRAPRTHAKVLARMDELARVDE